MLCFIVRVCSCCALLERAQRTIATHASLKPRAKVNKQTRQQSHATTTSVMLPILCGRHEMQQHVSRDKISNYRDSSTPCVSHRLQWVHLVPRETHMETVKAHSMQEQHTCMRKHSLPRSKAKQQTTHAGAPSQLPHNILLQYSLATCVKHALTALSRTLQYMQYNNNKHLPITKRNQNTTSTPTPARFQLRTHLTTSIPTPHTIQHMPCPAPSSSTTIISSLLNSFHPYSHPYIPTPILSIVHP